SSSSESASSERPFLSGRRLGRERPATSGAEGDASSALRGEGAAVGDDVVDGDVARRVRDLGGELEVEGDADAHGRRTHARKGTVVEAGAVADAVATVVEREPGDDDDVELLGQGHRGGGLAV